MNDDNLALRFGWVQRYRASGCQGHLPSLPDTRKNFPASAEAIRNPLGNVQRRVLTLPTPRKRSAACFGAFRPLGNVQRRVLTLSEASGRLRTPANLAGYPANLAGVPDAPERGRMHVPNARTRWHIHPLRDVWRAYSIRPYLGTRPPTSQPAARPQQTNRAAGPNTSTPHRGECTYPERPVGPPDHSPGRNPGAKQNTPPPTGPQGPNG